MSKRISKQDYSKIKRNIIKKLYSHSAFAKGHMLYERIQSGIPSHLCGFVKDILKDLIKEGIVQEYAKTKHGNAFQLNISKLKEIEEIIFVDGTV